MLFVNIFDQWFYSKAIYVFDWQIGDDIALAIFRKIYFHYENIIREVTWIKHGNPTERRFLSISQWEDLT